MNKMSITSPYNKEESGIEILENVETSCQLIVWNDDVNTFDWVIETLIKICAHTLQQAEQCTMIIHTKGKYGVKEGSHDFLKPMCNAITERGIDATIEVITEY